MLSAGVWFGMVAFVLDCLPFTASMAGSPPSEPAEYVYASPDGSPLKAYIFSPEKAAEGRRPAIVLFHGGGWVVGEPQWAFSRARHFAGRGMVAIAAQYRLSDQRKITPIEAMEDARAVLRWARRNADTLDIDPKRIAVTAADALARADRFLGSLGF